MLMATRSENGATWSTPTTIAEADPSLIALGSAAVAPDGTIYVSWAKDVSDARGRRYNLMYSKSTDGGLTWLEKPQVIADQPGPPEPGSTLFLAASPTTRCISISAAPSLAVSADGTVGVAFYDHRNDDPRNDPPKVTDF